MILVVGLLTVLCTFLGGLFAIRFRDKLHLILGFSAGAVLGVAFFDLLPESLELASSAYDARLIMTFIASGFALYMILDRFFMLHAHGSDDECENEAHSGVLGASALSFHSFLDGIGIGLAFKVSPAIGWIVAAAVLTHDFSDGINTVGMVLKCKKDDRKRAMRWLILDALAPLLGISATLFFSVKETTLGLILAIFTGLFFYIGASDLVPESHHRHPTIWTTLMTIAGMALLYGAIRIAG